MNERYGHQGYEAILRNKFAMLTRKRIGPQQKLTWSNCFIAQSVEHCTSNTEVMGSIPVYTRVFFFFQEKTMKANGSG